MQPPVGSSLQSNSSIIGKWEITSDRAVGEPKFENFSKDGRESFFALFGVTYWVLSEGKTFNLLENGHVQTDIAEADLIKQLDMRYEAVNESLLEFNCKFPKDSIRNIMPVKYEIIGDQMP